MLHPAMSVPETQRGGSGSACTNGPETNRMQFRRRKKQLRMGHDPRLLLKAPQRQAGRSRQSRQFQERRRCPRGERGIEAERAARKDTGQGLGAKTDGGLGREARVGRVLRCLGRTTKDVGLARGQGLDPDPGKEEGGGGMTLKGAAEEVEICLQLDQGVLMVALSHLSSQEGLPPLLGGNWGAAIRDIR